MSGVSERIDVNDEFNLIDIRSKCPYDNRSDEEAINDLKKCFVYCESVPPVFMIKTYDSINENMKVSYTNETVAKSMMKKVIINTRLMNGRMKNYSLWDLFNDNQLEFTVKGLKFYSEDKQVFSYFRGYDYKKLDKVKDEVIRPFLNHVHDVIANNNEEVYKYIILWIASILQQPSFKTETALVILGRQGTGKNTFFTNVICKLMSRYANENVTSIEPVVGKFNAVLENKKLIILNELQSIDSNKYLNSDALKSVITDKKININQKNEPERLTDNVANFIMVSNNSNPIKIENGDRRYVVTKTSNKHKDDFDYFESLSNSFTPEFYENLFTFFMTIDLKNANLRKLPMTESKEDIKEASMSSYELFVRECYEEIQNITGPDLFNKYNDFVEKNKFKPCSSRTFIANIKEFTGKAEAKWIGGRTQKVYSLLPGVYDEMKKYNDDLEKQIIGDSVDEEAL